MFVFRNVMNLTFLSQLNRSDSDSSMPLYRRCGGPFQRNSVERRSLRWRRSVSGTKVPRGIGTSSSHGPRTSLDLELDLRAQHTRLQALQDELARLRDLKARLEVAREKGDSEVAAWVLEDTQFQNLIAQVHVFHFTRHLYIFVINDTEKIIHLMLQNKNNIQTLCIYLF